MALALARTLFAIVFLVLALGAVVGGAAYAAEHLAFRLPWWSGVLGGFGLYVLLFNCGMRALHQSIDGLWRDDSLTRALRDEEKRPIGPRHAAPAKHA